MDDLCSAMLRSFHCRAEARRGKRGLTAPRRRWNLLDVVIVFTSLIDLGVSNIPDWLVRGQLYKPYTRCVRYLCERA